MSWFRSWTSLSQFLRVFLPTMAVHLAVAGDVFDDVFFLCCPFSDEMSWMGAGQRNGA